VSDVSLAGTSPPFRAGPDSTKGHAVRVRTALAILVASTLGGCAPPRAPLTSPGNGGPPWSELVSEHVRLETDLPIEEAKPRLASFEQMYAALSSVMAIDAPPKGPRVEVVLFSRKVDFLSFVDTSRGIEGYFAGRAPGDLEPQPLMVIQEEESADAVRITFQHELAHRLLHTRFVALDRWLDEGMAQYYSTVEVHPEGLIVGEAVALDFWDRPYAAYTWLGQLQQLNLPIAEAPRASAIVTSGDAFYSTASAPGATAGAEARAQQAKNYATAWRLVHYLFDEAPAADRARFAAYLHALEQGEHDAFASRFAAEMPRIDREFQTSLTRPARRSILRRGIAESTSAPAIRRLSDVEVHLLWSRLFQPDDDRAGGEAAAALRLAPNQAEPHFQRAAIMLREHLDQAAGDELARARALAPHEPRYLYAEIVLAEARKAAVPPEVIAELARTAKTSTELGTAAHYVGKADLGDGLVLAARAIAADPLCWRCQVTRAELLARGGAIDDALGAIDRAIALVPERESAASALAARQRLLARKAAATK
jgi:hypothetical protein